MHSSPKVVFRYHANRWAHALSVAVVLAFMAIFYVVVFVSIDGNEPVAEQDTLGGGMIAGMLVAAGVLVFLLVAFTHRLVMNPPALVIYEEGFEYAPTGVSTGFIPWSDVVALHDETVLTSLVGTPGRRPVTAVVLRNLEQYLQRFPAPLRQIFRLSSNLNSSPILIPDGSFGREHASIIAMMRYHAANVRAPQRTPGAR